VKSGFFFFFERRLIIHPIVSYPRPIERGPKTKNREKDEREVTAKLGLKKSTVEDILRKAREVL